jgi:hypothetical protein
MQPQRHPRPLLGRVGGLVAVVITMAIVGLIAALLVSTGGRAGGPAFGFGQRSGTSTPGSGPPGQSCGSSTPGSGTPGPQASYIPWAVLSSGVDAQGDPTGITSSFRVGQPIYVVFQVHGISAGHLYVAAVDWRLAGQLYAPWPLPNGPSVKHNLSHDGIAYLVAAYLTAGRATAGLHLASLDSHDFFGDDTLAWTLPFTVVSGQPSGTPTWTPTPPSHGTPTTPPSPCGTPSLAITPTSRLSATP